MMSSVDCCVFTVKLVQWIPVKANKPCFLLCCPELSWCVIYRVGGWEGISSVCALSMGNSHGLLRLPFAPADGFLHCKSLGWSGEPCFFSAENPGVQMQRGISLHCRVFLFS